MFRLHSQAFCSSHHALQIYRLIFSPHRSDYLVCWFCQEKAVRADSTGTIYTPLYHHGGNKYVHGGYIISINPCSSNVGTLA